MLKSTFNLWWASLLSLFLLGATSHVTQSQQVHDLTFGKTIDGYASTGGEGWIQNPGEVEIFRFEVTVPGQKIFLEWGEQDPALRQLPVKLLDPWGKDLFGSLQVVAAQGAGGVKDVVRQGAYEIVVGSEDAVVQGRYQLTVHAVDWPEVFDLPPAGVLAPNLPAKGAGIIEAPGSVDTFLFTSEEQQQFILEFQHWEPGLLYVDWSIQNQLIGTLYSGNIGTYEKRIFTIQKPGDYRLEIGDGKDAGTGAYGLTFRAVPPPERFSISLDEVIELPMSDDGSGFIEAEAAADHYIWTQHEPGRVLIDLVDFDEALLSCQMGLYGPNSDEIFRPQSFFGNDPGSIFLETSGTYTLQVGGNLNSGTGAYSLRIQPVPPDDEFNIQIGQTIEANADQVGMGGIEFPGARDVYRFEGVAGQRLFVQLLSSVQELGSMPWTLEDPTGKELFSQCMTCSHPDPVPLLENGTYLLRVGGQNHLGTGLYRFKITEVPMPLIYPLQGDRITVLPDQPEMGAGVLDLPGEVDVYSISLTKGETCHLKMHPGSLGLDWKLTNPYGEVVFDSSEVESFSPKPFDQFIGVEHTGVFYLQVFRTATNRIEYGFDLQILSACLDSTPASVPSLPSIGFLNWKNGDGVEAASIDLRGSVGWDAGVSAMDLMLVMDSSKSLVDSDPDRKRLEALREFIDSLPEQIPLQLGLVDFDQYANLVQPLTASRDAITDRLEDFDASGGTNIERALNVALDELEAHAQEGSLKTIVLFSDGETSEGDPVAATLRAQLMGVSIHTVFLGEPGLQGSRWMEAISLATCGNHRSVPTASQLAGIFTHLTPPVPIAEVKITSSAMPEAVFHGSMSGSFWEAEAIPMLTEPGNETEFTITMTTMEPSSRTFSSTLKLRYGVVENQAPTMQPIPQIESNEDEKVLIRFWVQDEDDPDFVPDFQIAFSQPEWVDMDRGMESSFQNGELTVAWYPAGDRHGMSKVTLSVADAQGARSEQTASWNLRSINDPPFFQGPEGVTVKPGQPILPIPITKITDGSDFEQQALTFYLEVEGDPLIASHQMVFQQGESSGYLNITLHPAAHGKAELALRVDDGSQMHSTYIQRFPLIVEPPDNLKPTVTWLNPRSGASMVLRDTIELKVFAEDLDGTIASLLFHANGVPIGEADPIGGSLEWIPSTQGSYQLTATVIDDLGASTLSEPIEIRVDPMVNQAPLVEWLEPSGETSLWLGQTLRMQIRAQDPDGVITRARFLVNGAFLGEGIENSQEWDWTPGEIGRYALSAMVEDDSGASSTTPSRWVTVVARPPEFGLEILEPKDRAVVCRGQSTRVELSLEGDPPEGVVVHLYAGDRLVALRSAAPYVFDWAPDSVGDFLLRAVAFREDGTEVSSSPVRIGVSSTCFQVGLLPTAVPVVEKELIQDLLFEMGVGMHWLPSELEDPAALDGMDMILAMEDAEVGVSHEMLGWLEYLYFDRQLPVYLLGNHLLSATSGLTSEERQRWEHLVHLQGQGVEGVHQQVVLEERGFFQSFLQGRFGQVSPFVVSGEMDQASATSNAEAIVRLDETDLMVRYPAGGRTEAAQPRWVSQNFPLFGPMGQEKDPIRRALFQNALCWLLQCGTCSLNDLQLTLKDWNGESTTGEWVEQSFELANVGACEATDTQVFIKYPKGVELGRAEFSQGLGAENHPEGGVLQIHVGRLTHGAASKMMGSFRTQALIPGLHEIQVCVESNHTESNCETYYWMTSGDPLMPATIAMHWSEDRMLWLRVEGLEGLEGMSYRIQMSHDLETWVDFADAPGPLTELPIPQDLSEGVPATFFRLVSGMQ